MTGAPIGSPPEAAPAVAGRHERLVIGLGLAALIVLHAFFLVRWTRLDRRPAGWDQAIHLEGVLDYQERFRHPALFDLLRPAVFNYPPLYYVSLVPFVGSTEDIADIGAIANIGYVAALVIGTFLLARRRLDAGRALAAATLVGVYPMIIKISRDVLIDVPLTAWVVWCVYALERTERFRRRGWSIAFGAMMALASLTKWTAPAYVLGPFLWVIAGAIRERRLRGFGWSVAAAALVAGPWYLVNGVLVVSRLSHSSSLIPATGVVLSGWASTLWYPVSLFEQMNLPLLLLFLPGLVVGVRRRELRPLLAMIVVSFALFTLIHNRNSRYGMPVLPAAAILTAAWLPARRWAAAALVAVALLWYGFVQVTGGSERVVSIAGVPCTLFSSLAPEPGDWKHREVIETIDRLRSPDRRVTRVVVVSNHAHFHGTTLAMSAGRLGVEGVGFRGPSKRRWLELNEFVLAKTGSLGPEYSLPTIRPVATFLENPSDWFRRAYKEVGRWPLADGSEAILYQWKPEPSRAMGPTFTMTLKQLELPNIVADRVRVSARAASPAEAATGRFDSLMFEADAMSYKGVRVSGIRVRLVRPVVNMPLYEETGEVQLVAVDRIEPAATVSASEFLSYAERKARWLGDPALTFEGDRIRVAGRVGRLNVRTEAAIRVEDASLRTRVEALSIGGVPFPLITIRAMTDRTVPLAASGAMPYDLAIAGVDGSGDRLTIRSREAQ